MTSQSISGGCLCGKIRYRINAAPVWAGYCHCRSCRRFTGSIVTNWLGMDTDDIEFTAGNPAVFADADVERGFCPECGSSLTYAAKRFPGYIQVHVGSLDDPERFEPHAHVHYAERVGWFHVDDRLPRFDHSMADASDDWRADREPRGR